MGLLQKKEGKHSVIKQAFHRVKQDTSSILQWLHFFHRRQEEHDIRLTLIEKQVSMPQNKNVHHVYHTEELDTVQNYVHQLHSYIHGLHSSIAPLLRRMEHMEKSIESKHYPDHSSEIKEFQKRLQSLENSIQSKVSEGSLSSIHERISAVEKRRESTALETHVIKKVAKDSRTYIKKMILSLIYKYGTITGTQIREMLVEEQKLTSKSSLYRALNELEKEGSVHFIWNAKEKIYNPKSVTIDQ